MMTTLLPLKNRMNRPIQMTLAVVVLFGALGAGCGKSMRVYVHPDADLAFYSKVGVLPFRSLAGDRFAGEKIGIEFTTALLAKEIFEVYCTGGGG